MTGKKTILHIAVLVAGGLVLAACTEKMRENPKQTAGAAIGGIAGGLAGAQFGGGKGTIVTAVIGSLVGAWLGSEAGKSLDEADAENAGKAARDAMEHNLPGQSTTWYDTDSGRSGSVTPSGASYARDGRECRDFESTVTIDGRPERSRGLACREEDGSWQIAHTVPAPMTPTEAFVSQSGRECRNFDSTFTIAGEVKTSRGLACRQPDGTWRVSHTVPAAAGESDRSAGVPEAPECRDFQGVVMDGESTPVAGRACRQADGTWRIVR